MKEKQNITALLGLTQLQVAMLLGVGRSQWALYELGLRPLPLSARQQLPELIAAVQKGISLNAKKSPAAEEKLQHRDTLQKLLLENGRQQEKLSRKIAALEKKNDASIRTSHLARHLNTKGEFNVPYHTELLKVLEAKATKHLEKNGWSKVSQYQIKLKVLQYEEKVLQEEIKHK